MEHVADKVMMAHAAPMSFVRIRLLPLLICVAPICSASRSQTPKPTPAASTDFLKMLNAQVGGDDALPGEHKPTALRMQFVKIDSAAFTRGKTVGHFARYRVLVTGAPRGLTYALAQWKIGSQIQVAYSQVYVNANG